MTWRVRSGFESTSKKFEDFSPKAKLNFRESKITFRKSKKTMKSKSRLTNFRLPEQLADRIAAMVKRIKNDPVYAYIGISHSAVIRMALDLGLGTLEKEFSLPPAASEDDSIEVDLRSGKFKQAEIARRHGCSRQNVNRIAKRLREKGQF